MEAQDVGGAVGVAASRPMTASAVTDLPQPDSPTRHWVSPRFTVRDTPRTAAIAAAEGDAQVGGFEDGRHVESRRVRRGPLCTEGPWMATEQEHFCFAFAHRACPVPSRSRNPSPSRLMPSTSTNSATPGIMITHGEKNM